MKEINEVLGKKVESFIYSNFKHADSFCVLEDEYANIVEVFYSYVGRLEIILLTKDLGNYKKGEVILFNNLPKHRTVILAIKALFNVIGVHKKVNCSFKSYKDLVEDNTINICEHII